MSKFFKRLDYIEKYPWTDFQLMTLEHAKDFSFQMDLVKRLLSESKLASAVDFLAEYQRGTNFFFSVGPHFSFEEGCLHEISHAIQLKKSQYKVLKTGRFFAQPKSSTVNVLGKTYYEPVTCEPTIMEAETVAIQLHLLEMLNYGIDHESYINSWTDTLLCGALPDFIPERANPKSMVRGFIMAFYQAWIGRSELIELRLNNFAKYMKNCVHI